MAVVEVAAGVVIRGDAVLVCQRAPGASHPLKWEFPGGKRHPGETLPECARRELREELGLDVEIGDELWRTRHYYQPDRPVDLFFFLVTKFSGEPVNHVFAAIRWVDCRALDAADFLEADHALVRFLSARVEGHAPSRPTRGS